MKASYKPTEQERSSFLVAGAPVEVLVDLELMTGREYPLSELDEPSADPGISYIRELKRVSCAVLEDIVVFETKSLFTFIVDELSATKADLAKISADRQEVLEDLRGRAHKGVLFETAWADVIFGQLCAQIPNTPELAKLLNRIKITQSFTRSPNGWVTTRDKTHIVVLDATLKLVLEYVSNFLFYCKHRIVNGDGTLPFDWVSRHLAPLVLYFVSDIPASRLPWILAPSRNAALYTKTIVVEQLRFIIAHEIGHVCLGHLGGDASPGAIESADAAEKLAVSAYTTSQTNEFAADQFGVSFGKAGHVTDSLVKKSDSLVQVTVFRMAVELLFLVFDLIEQVGHLADPPVYTTATHPPAIERLRLIQNIHCMDQLNDRKSLHLAQSVFSQWIDGLRDRNITLPQLKEFTVSPA